MSNIKTQNRDKKIFTPSVCNLCFEETQEYLMEVKGYYLDFEKNTTNLNQKTKLKLNYHQWEQDFTTVSQKLIKHYQVLLKLHHIQIKTTNLLLEIDSAIQQNANNLKKFLNFSKDYTHFFNDYFNRLNQPFIFFLSNFESYTKSSKDVSAFIYFLKHSQQEILELNAIIKDTDTQLQEFSTQFVQFEEKIAQLYQELCSS